MTPMTRKMSIMKTRAQKGFTLAELLIALAILGVIATFTIPKILTSTGTAQFKASTKEAASIISGAIQDFGVNNPVTATSTFAAMLANVNYVQNDQASLVAATGLNEACSATAPCLVLHNGGILQYSSTANFGSTANTHYLVVNFDPDGTKSAVTTDIVTFAVGSQGKVVDITNRASTGFTTLGGGTSLTAEAASPSWASNLWQ